MFLTAAEVGLLLHKFVSGLSTLKTTRPHRIEHHVPKTQKIKNKTLMQELSVKTTLQKYLHGSLLISIFHFNGVPKKIYTK